LIKRDRFRAFLFLFAVFSVYIFIFSESGLLARLRLGADYKQLEERIERLDAENRRISTDIGKYSEGLFSHSDIIGAGYVSSGGRVIHFSGSQSLTLPEKSVINMFELELNHLRIIWILFSIVITMYYFTRKQDGAGIND